MENIAFEREKLRRGLQEMVNSCDEATVAESRGEMETCKTKDQLTLVQLLVLGLSSEKYQEEVMLKMGMTKEEIAEKKSQGRKQEEG